MLPKWGHFFTLTERMAVAILEEVNNHPEADFKRLKDIGGGHTIYRNGTKRLWMKHMARKFAKIEKSLPAAKKTQKNLPFGSFWVGSVGPPETQVFFFWPN